MNRRMHYAWLIALGCGIVMFYCVGLGFNCLSVFLNPLMERIHVSNTMRSTISAFYQTGSVAALLCIGPVIEKIGARKTILIFGICMASGYLMLMAVDSVQMSYAAMFIIGIGYGAGGLVPVSILITTWFAEKRGFALGLAMCGSGAATIIAPTILSGMIASQGVQKALGMQAMAIVICTLTAGLLLRNKPEDLAMKAYGQHEDTALQESRQEKITIRKSFRDKKFFLMALAVFLSGLIVSPVVTHLAPIIDQSGYGSSTAAAAVSAYGISMFLGKPIFGKIIDRFGVLKANTYAYTFIILTMLTGMLLGEKTCMAYAFGILFGLGGATVITVGLPIWTSELFGRESVNRLYSIFKLTSSLAGAVGAIIPGIIIDKTGSYFGLFLLYILAAVLSYVILRTLFIRNQKEKVEVM